MGRPFALSIASCSVFIGVLFVPALLSAPRLLDTKTPQSSPTGCALSLGTQPTGIPPPPPPPPPVPELVIPVVGQFTSAFSQLIGVLTRQPARSKIAPPMINPRIEAIQAPRRMTESLFFSISGAHRERVQG